MNSPAESPAPEVEQASEDRKRNDFRSRRTVGLVVGLVVVAIAVAAGVVVIVHHHNRLPADAVFRYDGRTYLESDLAHYDQLQHALYGIDVPDLSQPTLRREAAQTYAVSLVVDRAADQAGVSVSNAEVSVAEQDFITRAYPSGRSSFINALASEGLSEDDVLTELRRQLVIKQLYDQVTNDVSVDAAAVAAAYHTHENDFADPESRLVSEIVVARRGEALALKGQLSHGRNFAATAKKVSLDSTTSSKGGSLGFVAKAQLQGPFGSAAFAAKPGHVFGPIQAAKASYFYLGVVTKIRPAHVEPLSKVRSQLSQELAAARGLATWEKFLKEKIAAAGVVYGKSYRPTDPDAVPGDNLPADATSSPATNGSTTSPGDGTSDGASH